MILATPLDNRDSNLIPFQFSLLFSFTTSPTPQHREVRKKKKRKGPVDSDLFMVLFSIIYLYMATSLRPKYFAIDAFLHENGPGRFG